ncbi:MAG: 16S rRNA (adenine(1518)-N(6)/adenine(1519)-N(6))-dimethyltransferase RsmA [Steroidobacteraceae bacterium]
MALSRKRFGQHFLHDPAVIERIARAVGPRAGDHLVEIGPGRGALTRRLLQADFATLDAVEIDRDLAALLGAELASDTRFALQRADALDLDLDALAERRGGKLRVVGNLPYNLSTPLLFHFLDGSGSIEDMHLMLQREVVARMTARPGTGEYGRLTVMLAPRARAERLFDIGPGAFQPPPKVWSSIVRLEVLREPAFAVAPDYGKVVAAAFAHRRKTLRNALRGLVSLEQIEACGLDPTVRPETLTPQAFNELARAAARAEAGCPSPSPPPMG